MGSVLAPEPEAPPVSRWRLLHGDGSFDPRFVRIASATLLAGYGIIVLNRPVEHHPEFVVLRGLVCVLAACGAALAYRFTWFGLRAYTVLLTIVLALGASYIDAALGNGPRDIPLTGLATFVPLAFLQTGWDVLVVVPVLVAGNAAILHAFPPTVVPITTVAALLGGVIASGTVMAVTLLVYRLRLNDSLHRLERALGAKNEFLNTMSHELRSPLHVVIGYADMLREGTEADSVTQLGARIRASALELLQLVENTMKVARFDAGKVTLTLDEFAPAEVVRELADCVRALPEAKTGVPVRWRVAPDVPAVRLDRLKLKEIIQNLVSNALKFTREGTVTVAVEREAEELRIAVQDTGPGIPPESQARIFELFERVEDDQAAPGVGLGLYIVKSLVQLMRGQIEVRSAPGHGACFTVRLPLRLATT
ncbi:MAG TPA: HAMP domain-containing sensor histidine kinase [Candidatus Binatia bacterium]|nr:HAMP domain-containing sensor histidine kinase [Candidatus Binatia bacterium]